MITVVFSTEEDQLFELRMPEVPLVGDIVELFTEGGRDEAWLVLHRRWVTTLDETEIPCQPVCHLTVLELKT